MDELEKCARVLDQLSHPIRLDIIQTLIKFESMTIEELNRQVKVDSHLLGHHVSLMKIRGILKQDFNRDGRILYSLGTVIRDGAKLIFSLNLLTTK